MKKLIIIGMLLLAAIAVAEEDKPLRNAPTFCPKTKISDQKQCLNCHTAPNFRLRESAPLEGYLHPDWLRLVNSQFEGYFLMTDTDAVPIDEFFKYLNRHGVKRATIEIFSPGGSMMQAWRIVATIEANPQIEVTTKVKGYAASAGFMILVAGKKRLVSPTSLLMWHELQTFKMFDISSPSDKEEEARVLRLFQDNANSWLAARSKISKDRLDQLIKKKEFWMTGKQAIEMGFADGFLNE